MKNQNHSIQYNFIMNFLLTATNFIFPLITFPYITRVLQAEGTGTVSFAASVTNYFLMVANLGIPTYGIRATAKARDNKNELTKVCHELLIINAVTTILSLAAYLVAIALVPQFREEKQLFYINTINVVLNLFGMHWLFQGLEQYDYITFRSVAAKIISVVLMISLVHSESDYVLYAAISIFAAAGTNILNFIRAGRYISFRPQKNYQLRKHIKPILVLFAQTMVVSVYTNLDTVMLGLMNGNSEVGLYTTAVKVKGILLSLVSSLGAVLLPRMSNVVQRGDTNQFNELTKKALNVTMLMAFPLSIYFCIYAKESVLFLAGDGFIGAVLAMQIITVSIIPNGLTGVLGIQVLTSIEKEKYVLYSVTAGAISDFLLNLVFIPNYGAAGAAFATTVAEFIVLLMQLYYTKKIIAPVKKQLLTHIYVIGTIAASVLSWVAVRLLNLEMVFAVLCVSAMVFGVVYFAVLYLFKEPLVIQYLNKFKNVAGKLSK